MSNSDRIFMGVDHPAIASANVDSLAKWYCEVLGCEKYHREDKPVWMLKAKDGSLLEIMPIDDTERPKRTTWAPGWSHLAVRVSDFSEAESILDRQRINWTSTVVEAIGSGKVRSFEDPEGNMLKIIERHWKDM